MGALFAFWLPEGRGFGTCLSGGFPEGRCDSPLFLTEESF